MVNSEEVAGFQFSIEGAMVTGVGGGSASAAGFTVMLVVIMLFLAFLLRVLIFHLAVEY